MARELRTQNSNLNPHEFLPSSQVLIRVHVLGFEPSPSWIWTQLILDSKDSKGIVHRNGNKCRDSMCVVFLMWEGTLYVTLTVSASTRMDTLLQIANKDSSVPLVPLQARKSPRRPNNLDCIGGIWTQSFRQGHGNVDKVVVSCSLGAACHLR